MEPDEIGVTAPAYWPGQRSSRRRKEERWHQINLMNTARYNVSSRVAVSCAMRDHGCSDTAYAGLVDILTEQGASAATYRRNDNVAAFATIRSTSS